MKKIAIIFAMASLLFAACGENTKFEVKYDHPERYSVGDATLSQPVSGISIDWVCGEVDIVYTDDPAVRIHEEIQEGFLPLTDSLQMRYYVDDEGTLEIQYIGPGKYRYGDMKNIRKHLVVEVPRGTELKDIDIDGVDNRVRIEQVLSREVTVDGVKVNVNAHYPDTMPDEIGIDGVNCLLALYVQPSAGLTVEMSGLTPELRCDLPSRKEGEKTIVGDGGCKVDADGVNVKLIVSEWK